MLPDDTSKALKPPTSDDKRSLLGVLTPSRIPTPSRFLSEKSKRYLLAISAFKHGWDFSTKPSAYEQRKATETVDKEGQIGLAMTALYVGISAAFSETNTSVVAIAIRDAVYLQDFSVKHLDLGGFEDRREDVVTDYIINELSTYERKNLAKFIGAGVPDELMRMAPKLCPRLWAELDIVPITITPGEDSHSFRGNNTPHWDMKNIDEQADSMARKCIMCFGPNQSPLLQVGYRGMVEIDASFHSHMCTVEDYKTTCGERTWASMIKFATSLKQRGTQIAFFSSTPQGGGVALMRHALVRFARVMGVDLTWYVPKPKPGVFRITKNVHNILQGVAKPEEWISSDEKRSISDWIKENATRYWLSEGGPLRDPSEGGADVIIIDDPQMPGLIPLAKEASPKRPVLYRSHIQIRSDLVEKEGTPQADVWQFLWNDIQHADMFISHPMPSFVPKNVPRSKVAFLPATTDWLDGLNKPLNDWDKAYYGHVYNTECLSMRMTPLKDHSILAKYFIQVARFDPSKGIPDVIKSYTEFYRLLKEHSGGKTPKVVPQLLIVGNSSIDDPDAASIYSEAFTYLETNAPHLVPFVSIMRLAPNDQLLNALLTNAHTAMQLSTREGFEVKVSEALHHGTPIIATRVGGIPLQVREGDGNGGDGATGFLVEPRDWKAAGAALWRLWSEPELHARMSAAAKAGVSDEIGTVGNALAWFFLADRCTPRDGDGGGGILRPGWRWVNDLARVDAGMPYVKGENRLPRASTLVC